MNLGVMGAGWWGTNIINSLELIPEVERVVVFDERKEVREKFRQSTKAGFAGSADELLQDASVDAVCLATPPETHYPYSKRVLLAGKHLMVEKPPAREAAQVRELGEIAKTANLVYMIDALYLFLEPVQRMKEMIASRELRNIRAVEMFRVGDELRRAGSGIERLERTMLANGIDVVEDLFFHDAAILLDFFGDFRHVSTERSFMYHPSLCDTARIRLETAQGIPVELLLSWVLAGRRRGIVIYDHDSLVEYDGLKSSGQLTVHHVRENRLETLSFGNTPPLTSMLHFFVHCIKGEKRNHLDSALMERLVAHWKEIREG